MPFRPALLARSLALLLLVLMPAAGPAVAEPLRRPSATQMEALRRWLCPNGGSPVRGRPGRCDGAGGRGLGLAQGGSEVPGWDRGLPPPQRDARVACPPGTKAVLARAHTDVTRCLPE
jgi:hypothetical protein